MSKIKTEDKEKKNNSKKSKVLNILFGLFIISLIVATTIFIHKISVG